MPEKDCIDQIAFLQGQVDTYKAILGGLKDHEIVSSQHFISDIFERVREARIEQLGSLMPRLLMAVRSVPPFPCSTLPS